MTWVRIDDRVLSHPKIIAVPPRTRWTWVAGLIWSSQHRTDGVLPAAVLHTLDANRRDARALTDAGLWLPTENGGGWRIHDFADFQPVNGDLSAKRAAAGRAGARARWGHD